MKIFLIDDEKSALFFLEKALKELCPNDTIKSFTRYGEFIEAFKNELPETVFLDIEMPQKSGIELAEEINRIKEGTNIIFSTAYTNYALDAFNVKASAYVVKPVNKDNLKSALENLRYPVEVEKDIKIVTFGNFDIFFKGKPVKFRSTRSKHILAYLVDREGAVVTKKELAGIVYEGDYSKSIQATLSRNIRYLIEDLSAVGINDLIDTKMGYSIDLSKVTCDLIDYLEGKNVVYNEEYMEQYEFAEMKKYELSKNKKSF